MTLETPAAGGDLNAAREKYRLERDKRLRRDGLDQYIATEGAFAHYLKDSYRSERPERAPIQASVEAVVIGAGWSGMLAAVYLQRQGVKDFCLIDDGADFGGTWYWNRFPGAQCDIESHIYLPLLEETGYVPKEKYAFAEEIREHARRIGTHFDLRRRTHFQTQATALAWSNEDRRWLVETDRGDQIKATFVVSSCGTLNKPKLPGIPGLEVFKGHAFHTSRWDHAYTGHDLEHLSGKDVALIGTGATGIQCVPHLAEKARNLYVFQRTPSTIGRRNNCATDPDWARMLSPGWQKRRRANFYSLVSGIPQTEDLVDDGWTQIMGVLASSPQQSVADDAEAAGRNKAALQAAIERADLDHMTRLRSRIDAIVQDPATAEALKPWYRFFCKRPGFSDTYLDAFNRDNVTLVDTQGKGVEGITPSGLVSGGKEYPVNCIIFATGFEVGTDYSRRTGLAIRGRDSVTLESRWQDGYRTLHGVMTHRFPNLFFMGQTQGVGSFNFSEAAEIQAQYIADVVREAHERNADLVEPTVEGEENWLKLCEEKSPRNEEFWQACTPGYFNNEGKPNKGKDWLSQRFGGSLFEYCETVSRWCVHGMPGLRFERTPALHHPKRNARA